MLILPPPGWIPAKQKIYHYRFQIQRKEKKPIFSVSGVSLTFRHVAPCRFVLNWHFSLVKSTWLTLLPGRTLRKKKCLAKHPVINFLEFFLFFIFRRRLFQFLKPSSYEAPKFGWTKLAYKHIEREMMNSQEESEKERKRGSDFLRAWFKCKSLDVNLLQVYIDLICWYWFR